MPLDRLEKTALFGVWPGRVDAPLDSNIGQLRTQHTAVKIALEDYRASVAAIQGSIRLSDEGKAEDIRKEVKRYGDKLKEIRSRLPAFQKARDRILEAERLVEPEGWQKVIEYMQLSERRAGLAQMDELQRDLALLDAATTGDRLTLEAVRQAPPWQPLATPKRLAELERVLLENFRPQKAAELAEMDAGLAAVESAITTVENILQAESGEAPEPLTEMAGIRDDHDDSEPQAVAASE